MYCTVIPSATKGEVDMRQSDRWREMTLHVMPSSLPFSNHGAPYVCGVIMRTMTGLEPEAAQGVERPALMECHPASCDWHIS